MQAKALYGRNVQLRGTRLFGLYILAPIEDDLELELELAPVLDEQMARGYGKSWGTINGRRKMI